MTGSGAGCSPRSPHPCRRNCLVQHHPLHRRYIGHLLAVPRDRPAMLRNGTGRPHSATDQEARRKTGQDNDGEFTNTIGYPNIPPYGNASRSILSELEEAAIVPLSALLCSDASPREIVRRLRLNVAIRMLCDAIRETEVAI